MREEFLKILLQNRGKFISGEYISEKLGVTRAAVWKYVKALQRKGYRIESVTRKGYKLVGIPDILDPVILSYGMSTRVLGRNIEVHASIDSTNNRAKELALKGAPEGTLVIAERQTSGRGRLGRRWVSPPGGGIWMSLILRPDMPPDDAAKITTMAAVSVVKAVEKVTGLLPGIKWPNDIIVNNRKVCGILTEISAEPEVINFVVVGVGINVNMTGDDFPDEIKDIATSLRIEKGEKIDRSAVIRTVMEELEKVYYGYMKDRDFGRILKECKDYSVTLGRRVVVSGRTEEFEGYALDFAGDGSLLVRLDDGSVRKILSGDVSVRGIAGYV